MASVQTLVLVMTVWQVRVVSLIGLSLTDGFYYRPLFLRFPGCSLERLQVGMSPGIAVGMVVGNAPVQRDASLTASLSVP